MEKEKVMEDYLSRCSDIEDVWANLDISVKDYRKYANTKIMICSSIYFIGLVLAMLLSGKQVIVSSYYMSIVMALFIGTSFFMSYIMTPCTLKGLKREFLNNKDKSIRRALVIKNEVTKKNNKRACRV
ncbi:hypothetical protein UT300012_21470 [Paraclostridium bifermentans]